ncbi:DNA translocase FtsK 4TM domain-containing protein, partial [Flavobacterium sp.]|uniref:DNA translocase FtsK 4TM domain-containing protein n=1 Tax=Flavobacterium sp. TaxID=239 RepID=UPI00263482A4
MAKSTKKEKSTTEGEETSLLSRFSPSRQHKIAIGVLLVLLSIALAVSFVSYFVNGKFDQSELNDFANRNSHVQNWLGKFGAFLSDFFIYKGFGVASFLFVRLLFLTGAYLVLDLSIAKLKKTWFWDIFVIIILSILF